MSAGAHASGDSPLSFDEHSSDYVCKPQPRLLRTTSSTEAAPDGKQISYHAVLTMRGGSHSRFFSKPNPAMRLAPAVAVSA